MLVVFNSLGEFKEVGWRNGLLPAELDAFDWVCLGVRQNSEILVVAFAENTPGGGSVHALPMAKKILEEWHKINN